MSVLSFPIFALTFSAAGPITVLLYGERYRQSAPILALLALGCYFNVFLGFNLQTLKVFHKLKYIVGVSIVASLFNLGMGLILIHRYGALGAAISTAATLIFYNLLLQAGLILTNGLQAFNRQYISVYLTIVAGALGILAIEKLFSDQIYIGVPWVIVGVLAVLTISKRYLNAAETFPELLRVPVIKALIG